MANEFGTEGGLIGRIKSLIPGRGSKSTAPLLSKPRPEESKVAPEETPPKLSAFEQLEQFLAKGSGISTPEESPNKGPRSVEATENVYVPHYHDRLFKQPFNLHMSIKQGGGGNIWNENIHISVSAPMENPLEGQPMYKLGWDQVRGVQDMFFGYNTQNNAVITLSKTAPLATISFSPQYAALGKVMHLGDGWKPASGEGHRSKPPYTTNDQSEIAKIVEFITSPVLNK